MWQRFTERARRVILLGQEEAGRMSSGHVGTEHLLLGLVRENEGVGAQILLKMSISLATVRAEIENEVGPPSEVFSGEPKLTPNAKRVLELAADEARRMRHTYIGTEHLLLALLRVNDNISTTVLMRLGLDLDRARTQVSLYLGDELQVSLDPAVENVVDIVVSPHDITTPKGQIWRDLGRFINNLNSGAAFPLNFNFVFGARAGYFGANQWVHAWNEERTQHQIQLRDIDFLSIEGGDAAVSIGYTILAEQASASPAVREANATGWMEPLFLKLSSNEEAPVWQIVPTDDFPTSENPLQPPLLTQAAFALAQKTSPGVAQSQAQQSIFKLKRLCIATLQFVSDWDDTFAFAPQYMEEALAIYLGGAKRTASRNCFQIPDTEELYAFNDALSGFKMEAVTQPSQTVLFYEGKDQNLIFRYDGHAAVAFVNDSCRLVAPEAAPDLIWKP